MLFTTETLNTEEINSISNFFEEYDKEVKTVTIEETEAETPVYRYITSLTTNFYAKSVEDIAHTQTGNKRVRRRNLQQIMQESFFAGANRFGHNFIA